MDIEIPVAIFNTIDKPEIEPMINLGRKELRFERDGWTTRTIDGKCSAHFEHAVAIKKGKADILSDFGIIENVLSNLN